MSRSKRSKREIEPDYDEEEEDERLPYFVPEEGIDIEPLALYTRSILDQDAKVKLGNHPQRTNEKGFWIISSVPVSREDIAAMIEDTRGWAREKKKGHYVHSETAKRRLRVGRAPQGRDRASLAQPKAAREVDDSRYSTRQLTKDTDDPRYPIRQSTRESEDARYPFRQPSRMDSDSDPRFQSAPSITRSSTENVNMSGYDRDMAPSSPNPRPASVQPTQMTSRRPPSAGPFVSASPGYIQTTAQYTVQSNIPAPGQYTQYGHPMSMYESVPPPYQDNEKTMGTLGAGDGGPQPSTTGTQGFSTYATAGPTKPRAPANQGSRRH